MRILMLSDYLPPHVGGGVERVVGKLCEGLVRRGHSVSVLALRTSTAPANETRGRLTIRRVPALDLTPRLGVQLALSAHILPVAIQLVRRFQPDLIHVHNLFFRTTEAAALLRMMFRTPLVTTLHLARMEGEGRLLTALTRAYESTMGRFIVRRSDHVIATCQAVAEHARRMGRGAKPLTIISNGVDTKVFHPRHSCGETGRTILFVGRLVPNKGPHRLVKAAPAILARHPQARVVLVGDGPMRARLQKQIRRFGIEHAVQLLGVRQDVPELLRQATIFVRPSSLEGALPLASMEAMASGIPVVTTPVGGTLEIMRNGVHGFFVPVGDGGALADAIIKLLDDPLLAAEMGQRGRQLMEGSQTWDRFVEQTEEVYAQVVRR